MIALPIACGITGDPLNGGPSLLPLLSIAGLGLTLGPEMIVDGTFDDGTPWTAGLGWAIEDNVARRTAVASASGLSQPVAFVAGARHRTMFSIADLTAPLFAVQFTGGSTRSGTSRTVNGTYTETLLANTGNNSFRIFAGSNAAADIDNVSVRRIL